MNGRKNQHIDQFLNNKIMRIFSPLNLITETLHDAACKQNIFRMFVTGIAVFAFLQGCADYKYMHKNTQDASLKLDVTKRIPLVTDRNDHPLDLNVGDRMLLIPDASGKINGEEEEPLYRFRAKGIPIVTALDLFAHSHDLNIITSPEITGMVTVDFKDLPFEKAMEVILDAHGYYWSKEGNLIRVFKYETKMFIVDYLRLIREGKGSSQASLASSASNQSGGITIQQSDTIKFWEDIAAQLKGLLSDEGRITINRMSGTIHVTDSHKYVMHISDYINSITESIKRQVEINVKIMEVSLNDEFSLGIDWDLLIKRIFSLDTVSLAASTSIPFPFGGVTPKLRTISLGLNSTNFSAVIDALREQGELNVISRPSIRVMNNQPALIKVGTEIPFFNQTTTVGTAGSGNTITEEIRFITEGLVLSITPQISEGGLIILDVTPIISRLVDTATSNLGSTAPVMDVKQSTTVVQLRDGEMVTIGGLIQDSDSQTKRKIPVLGDVPLVGHMFKGRFTMKKKSELVMFITPNIIKDL